jgi:hypothetical protein
MAAWIAPTKHSIERLAGGHTSAALVHCSATDLIRVPADQHIEDNPTSCREFGPVPPTP